jgi:uncharacterized membrane protein
MSIKAMNKKLRTWSVIGGTLVGLGAGLFVASNRASAGGFEEIGDQAGNFFIILLGGALAQLRALSSPVQLRKNTRLMATGRNLKT